MSERVLILHYTPPGVLGGVEHIIRQHIELLTARDFDVEVVAGRNSGEARVPVHVIPEIDAARPESAVLEAELASGLVSERFDQTRAAILRRLTPLAQAADVLIAHNAFTLHFSLPLTAALWELAAAPVPAARIAWCHDLAWTNPLYLPAMHEGYPWSLLRQPAPNTQYVTVSDERRIELLDLWDGLDRSVVVVPNGIDPVRFLRLGTPTREIVERYDLFERDLVLLLPVRITRRKNIELAIRAVRALKDRGMDVRFLVSGPVAPHHPGRSRSYLEELKGLRAGLDLESEVVFLSDALGHNLDDDTVSELYGVADVLLFPSAQEGFGLPILEAGLARVPAAVSDIAIFREVGGEDVFRFDLDDSPDTIAASVIRAVRNCPSRLYRRVLREYRWDAIVDRKIVPLLRGPLSSSVGQRGADETREDGLH
jgi:glycosyltransferase involved in cell wall biosynthesis